MLRTKLFNHKCILSVFAIHPAKIFFFLIILYTSFSSIAQTVVESNCTTNCSIGDRVWEDSNANGIQDEGEPGLSGVLIYLEDTEGNPIPGIDYALSDVKGNYAFTDLPCQSYVVRFTTPSGFYLTNSDQGENDKEDSDANFLDGRSPVLDLTTINKNITDIDAGYYLQGSMIGRLWLDENLDGMEASNEAGATHVLTQIYNAGADQIANTPDDSFVAETTTDNLGYFEFFYLNPSSYFIKIDQSTLPIGYSFVTPEQGSENFDSDLDEITALSPVFEVSSGKNVSSVADGGLEPTCSFIPNIDISELGCQNYPVEFHITPDDENEYSYLWEFFDNVEATIKLGDNNTALTSYTWTTSGIKSYRLTMTNKDNCTVSFTKKLSVLSNSDSECLNSIPVEFLSLHAHLQSNKTSLLEWSTVWEGNNDYYEVQKSYDSTQFENIGFVDGKGTSEQINKYQFIDENPFFGRTYYRLNQVNSDGTINFSEVVSVLMNSEVNTDVIIQPNPTKSNITLRFAEPFKEDALVEIVSSTGQILGKQGIPAGAHTQEINLENYQTGFYLIHIEYNGFQKSVHRILKLRN